ncbi:hypothetical protein GGR53DRAFT_84781 [Hypoxylon sp. FL1150]|nr:hypothetical protein GGR53DRAFT_84781 [Hypoxylon sp. FL1150]
MSAEAEAEAAPDPGNENAENAESGNTDPGEEPPAAENVEPVDAEREASESGAAAAAAVADQQAEPDPPPAPAPSPPPPPPSPSPPPPAARPSHSNPHSKHQCNKPEKRIPLLSWLTVGGTGPPPKQSNFTRMARERNAAAREQRARKAARGRALAERDKYLADWEEEWGPVGVVGLVTKVLGTNRRKKT